MVLQNSLCILGTEGDSAVCGSLKFFEPVIADYYMYEEFNRTYLFLLRTSSESIFGDDQSQFIYIETK